MPNNRKGKMMIERAEEASQFWAYDLSYSKDSDLTLLDNVQFIYELSLAELELRALGVDFQVSNGLREFKIENKSGKLEEKIKLRTAYFKTVGDTFTDYFHIIQKNRTRSVNQYLTHWIYPYKGKFHPQMIRALLNIIGLEKGDTFLDPFLGSGTAALEAQLLGINVKGIDISPLCVLQGNVKTHSLFALKEILDLKDDMIDNIKPSLFVQEKDFHSILKSTKDPNARDFFLLARLLAVSDNSRRGKSFEQSFVKNVNRMIDSVTDFKDTAKELNLKLGKVEIDEGDARNLPLSDNSVDAIITSPPYSIALDYVENDAHSLADMGYDLSEIRESFIGVRGKPKDRVSIYNEDMRKSYLEMERVLKPGKYAVIIIGNATFQANEVKTVEFTMDFMQSIGLRLVKNINKIIFGLYNVMKLENILIFRKE